MSIRQGNNIIAGSTSYRPNIFDVKWSDHILNDIQWLRSDTFSWQSGAVYEAAYNHLVNDITSLSSTSSETVAGTTITFYIAPDGHKICLPDQSNNIEAIYAATGVAWYYILDTTNQRFKLPRTQFGMTGLRDAVGNYVEPSLPSFNSVGNSNYVNSDWTMTNLLSTQDATVGSGTSRFKSYKYSFGSSEVVQPAATQMYLYFYVGNFTQSALENTAGLNAGLFDGKADTDLTNVLANIDFVVERQEPAAGNNYTWYRKYRSGWVEQGGYNQNNATPTTVTLPIQMADTYYTATANSRQNGYTSASDNVNRNTVMNWAATICEQTTTTLSIRGGATESNYTGYNWRVEGMAA